MGDCRWEIGRKANGKGRESRRLGGWGFLLIVVCLGSEERFFLREDGRLQMGDGKTAKACSRFGHERMRGGPKGRRRGWRA
jgi:hypothetical protein